jgi:PAS domain S-box-containing protein
MQVGKEQSDQLLNQIEEPQVEAPQAEGRLRRKVNVGFASAVLLTGFLGVLSWRVARQAADDAQWVDHTHQVLITLKATVAHLVDVETGGRGFAMTGQKPFLEPFTSGKYGVGQDLDGLRLLMADNSEQERRLEVLAEQSTRTIGAAIDLLTLRQTTGRVPTEDQLERGKQRMDVARATVDKMEAAEKSLLQQRTEHARAAQRFMVSVIALGSVLGVVFLSIAGIRVSREVGISARARAQVTALNADLERRVAQRTEALGESEGRLAGVIQSAMDAILTVDEQQNILMFNAAAERMFRCPAAEALGKCLTRFIPQRFHAAHGGHIRKFADTGVTNRTMGPKNVLWALRADGQEIQIEASISQVVTGGKKLFTVILRDVTERVQAEAVREHLAGVVESSDDAIISKDLNGTINAWNHGAEKIFGYAAAEMIGKPMRMLIPAERLNEESDILSLIGRGESVKHFETVRLRKDGKSIDVSATISPIRDGNGVIVGASKIARDITERKAAEKKIREFNQELEGRVVERTAQLEAANKELEAFTYSVSHDLRAPLRHISGFTKILAEEFGPSLPAEGQKQVQRIEQGANHMGRLVDELLNLARVGRQSLTVQVTGLGSLVKEVRTMLEPESEGRQVEWKIGELPFLECDPTLVRLVFQNLIHNALKYSRPRSPAVIEIGHCDKEGQMVIFVRDNGVGFSMKYVDKLFGVFQRLHRVEDFEGTGVGLATVHRIITKHGGRVWAEAEVDGGASFYFTLGGQERSVAKTAAATAGGES